MFVVLVMAVVSDLLDDTLYIMFMMGMMVCFAVQNPVQCLFLLHIFTTVGTFVKISTQTDQGFTTVGTFIKFLN
jgi:hypothetical protein